MYRFKAGVFCVILSAFAASVLAVDLDTAFVPFLVNVDARVTAAQDGDTVSINAEANKEAMLRLPLAKTLGVTRRSQNALNNVPVLTSTHRGNVSLNLPGQIYKNAEVSLYTVNGKRIFRGNASASEAANSISRPNLVSGVYLLSVKGANGQSFSSRITHRGGSLNINVSFV
ncbi:MAG: T9SS type A sorting domain-containing protein, partial [Chitinispirillia bacterium]|nr:T9SS type A sorting domain-containing protein [Chitinispirillia bacterium]